MILTRAGSRLSQQGPADWFTGTVRIEPLNNPPEPSRVGVSSVTFQPGARTAWHTHPLGQTLIVTAARAGRSAKARDALKSARVT